MNNKTYSVYKHTSPSGKVYVGITYQRPERRWRNGKGYYTNPYFTRAIQKYGWDNFEHEILFENLSKEEAEYKEIELIKKYNSTNHNNGYNLDNGGNCIGKHSEQTILKIKKSKLNKHKGSGNPFYNKSHTNKTKEILSNKAKERYEDKQCHPWYNKHHSEETRKKLSIINTGHIVSDKTKQKISLATSGKNNPMYNKTHTDSVKKIISDSKKKPVCQYSMTGKFIKQWNSAKDIELVLNIPHSNISQSCIQKNKTAGGFIWRYYCDELTQDEIYKCNQQHKREIIQYTKSGDFIKKYDSVKLASEENNVDS